jgi:hypothetical protein
VDKSGVDHSVGSRCAAAKAFEIFERTAMYVGSPRDKGFGCRIRASEAEPASTTSPKRQVLEPELCIATFLREMH